MDHVVLHDYCPALEPDDEVFIPIDWDSAWKAYELSQMELQAEEKRKFLELQNSFSHPRKLPEETPLSLYRFSPKAASQFLFVENMSFDPNYNKIISVTWHSHHPDGKFGACYDPYNCKYCYETMESQFLLKTLPRWLCFHSPSLPPLAHSDPQKCSFCYKQYCLMILNVYPFKEDNFSHPDFPFLGDTVRTPPSDF